MRLPHEESLDHAAPKCMAIVRIPREVLAERMAAACLDYVGQGLGTVGGSAYISKADTAVLGAAAQVEQIVLFLQLERMGGDANPTPASDAPRMLRASPA